MKRLIWDVVRIAAALVIAPVMGVAILMICSVFGWGEAVLDSLETVVFVGGMFTFALFLLLPAGGIVASVFFVKTNWIKWLLTRGSVLTISLVLASFYRLYIFYLMLSPEIADRQVINDGKLEIMELGEFESFSGKENDKYYFKVLIKSPPKNTDSLKTLMAQYFYKKAQYINTVDTGSYLGSVHFYKYTQGNSKFINEDEDHTGFYTNYLDKYPETKIGYVSARNQCKDDTTKYYDELIVQNVNKNGKVKKTTRYTLYSECAGNHIDNRDKYK